MIAGVPVAAYCGRAPLPPELSGAWNFDPLLLVVLVGGGLWLLRHNSGSRAAVAGALAALLVAFVSPLCALTSALFAARAAHHLLLVAVAAPLLALALPRRDGGGVALPLAASSLTLWVWHVPSLYAAALSDVAIYWLMQISLLATGAWLWRHVLAPTTPMVTALAAIVAAFGQMGLLGALLTFAPEPLYAQHFVAPLAYGLQPLADQQLGGLIMWVVASLPYAVIAVVAVRRGWPVSARSTPA